MDISSKKIIIATHYLTYGASFALKDYLLKKRCEKIIFIAYSLLKHEKESYLEKYEHGKFITKYSIYPHFRINAINYLLEFINTVGRFIFLNEKFDVYIGVDPLNALA